MFCTKVVHVILKELYKLLCIFIALLSLYLAIQPTIYCRLASPERKRCRDEGSMSLSALVASSLAPEDTRVGSLVDRQHMPHLSASQMRIHTYIFYLLKRIGRVSYIRIYLCYFCFR